jgi:hypothetical protein
MATQTILPKKGNQAFALDDEHHEALAADPHITDFPQGSTFGDFNATTTTSAGNTTTSGSASTAGFDLGGFGSSTNSTAASSSFGGSGFGSTPSTTAQRPATPQVNAQQDQTKLIQSSGGAMQEGAEASIKADDKFGDFINSKWRPMMAVIYMLTCTCDFVIFPVLWSLLQAMSAGQVTSQWMPLTLQGAGLYHIAMGAVLGLAAYGRSQEKIAGKA